MGTILYTILIKPLELIFELIFSISHDIVPNPAVNLVIMSLAINLLVLPLYRRADIIQAEAKAKEATVRPMADHIKKHFKGDEKVMMLQILYEQKHYHPLSSLKSIISLLLQIPFFIAAYNFLSHLTLLDGQSMGPISDLAKPDGLITIGSISINLLPILMTVINIISSEIYTKGQPFKDKIVLYLSAAIFLVLLYDSPSGLVFYWTFNNVFALVKNAIYGFIPHKNHSVREKTGLSMPETLVFWAGNAYIAVFAGLYIPSTVLSAATLDFLDPEMMYNPSNYLVSSFCMSFGLYVVWIGVYFLLSSHDIRKIFARITIVVAVIATVDYFFFGTELGTLSSELVIENGLHFSTLDHILTCVVIVLICASVIVFMGRYAKIIYPLLIAGTIVIAMIGIMNTALINSYYDSASIMINGKKDEKPRITLSMDQRNVVVIMVDRAIGRLLPYIFAEKPELEQQFDGFTYYPNTVSFGVSTNFGAPTIYGGYEYTPEKMNSRSDELLKDKHNESLLVLPLVFADNGYNTTVIDPPYANYSFFPDLSIYEPYDNINAYQLKGNVESPYTINNKADLVRPKRFFLYSVMKMTPAFIQSVLYDDGKYNCLDLNQYEESDYDFIAPEINDGMSRLKGVWPSFIRSYTALNSLSDVTFVEERSNGCFTILQNETAHDPMILREPEYVPSNIVDNTEYDTEMTDRCINNGVVMHLDDYLQMAHYHNNMAAYIALGKWFDYLRDNGVWDNTRIIIVSDHGRALAHFDDMLMDDQDIEAVNALLLVKDFDSHGFNVSDEFMTIADTPTLATDGVISNPKNPFTGNLISSSSKYAEAQHIDFVKKWALDLNQGNVFNEGSWYSVHDNIFDKNNWEYMGEY